MKNILIFLSIFISFSCKEKGQEIKNIETKVDSLKKNDKELTYSFDTIKISELPFGNKMLIDNFKKTGSDYEVTKKENEILSTARLGFFKPYENILYNNRTPFLQFYKFPQKNTIDFGLDFITPVDSINTYQGYYALSERLPNIGENKILIFNSIDTKREDYSILNQNGKNNLIENIDLVVIDKNNKIVDNLNLSRSLFIIDEKYYNQYGEYFKYFYIDKDYTIHIKYFTGWGDAYVRVFAYVKYKIQEDGTIVRYFDQADGFYKTEVEEGNIKNHLKDGTWKEMGAYFEKNYYIKEYKVGYLIDNIKFYGTYKYRSYDIDLVIDKETYEVLQQNTITW